MPSPYCGRKGSSVRMARIYPRILRRQSPMAGLKKAAPQHRRRGEWPQRADFAVLVDVLWRETGLLHGHSLSAQQQSRENIVRCYCRIS